MAEQVTSETVFRIGYTESIEAVEVVKRTKCFVTIATLDWRGKRVESRESADKFYPTWEAAHARLIEKYENNIRWAQEKIHRLQSRLGQIRKMKP